MQKQEQNWPEEMKKNINFAFWLAQIVQRCFVPITRHKFGTEALGLPCLFAAILMWVWATFARDVLMLWWLGFWAVMYVIRRIEAARLSGWIYSLYDGWPFDALRFCKSEATAKRVVEPIMLAIVGFIAFKVYEVQGWQYRGLPYFFFAGAICVSFVAGMQERMWNKKVQAMRDGEIEGDLQESSYRDRFEK